MVSARDWGMLTGEGLCRVGAAGDLTVTAGEIADLDAEIRHLDADIQAQVTPEHAALFAQWTTFVVRWELWRKDNEGGSFAFLVHVGIVPMFHSFQAEYADNLRVWQGIIRTTAQPPERPTDWMTFAKWGLLVAAVTAVAVVTVPPLITAAAGRKVLG